MSPVRAIPTSRAYWELRAEQVLNRVFAPEAPIDVEVCETAASAPAAPPPPPAAATTGSGKPRAVTTPRRKPAVTPPQSPGWWRQLQGQPSLVLAAASVLVTVTAGTTLLGLSLWQQSQQAIRQERNMLLVERLRAMGPATAGPQAPATTATTSSDGSTATLPGADPNQLPPPPTEPWMEELASLPASSAPPANVLRVPMNGRVGSPAPPASGRAGAPAPARPASGSGPASAGDLPQLVGVVQVPGRPGSAIFQVEGSSTSAAAGESIGSSGWRLQSASGDSAVIERNGVQQRISISSGL